MKIKNVLLAGILFVSATTFAQKDELKALKKIYSKETPSASDVADFKTNITKLEPIATEEADKVYLSFYKAVLPQLQMASIGTQPSPSQLQGLFTPKAITELVSGYTAMLEYEKKTGKKVFTDDINQDITVVKPIIVNAAVALADLKKFSESSDVLFSAYELDKADQENLYYAASYAVNAKEYDKALKHYYELKSLNYSGEGTMYYATSKDSKKEEYFGTNPTQRDLMVKTGQYEKPRQEKIPSKKGEIYKNIALILVEQGKNTEAKAAIVEARKANPDDITLLITEADFYLKEKDFVSYTRLVSEALEKEPNNKQLVFNLGVISADSNKLEEAEKHYKRAIEIDPTYFDAYLNLSELKLRSEKSLVEQMNKLGTSAADNKKFDELRAKQIANYKDVLPYLEKAHELKPDDDAAKRTLMGVYQALEMTDKYKALKAKG